MLFAYVDESGDTGDPANGGSPAYALGVVLVSDAKWRHAFDTLIDMRRQLRAQWGIPSTPEIKAHYLVRGQGPLAGLRLSRRQRGTIYRRMLHSLTPAEVRVFAVVTTKSRGCDPSEIFDSAWEALLQRLANTSRYEGEPFLIVHDEGFDAQIRRHCRKARRFLTAGLQGGGTVNITAKHLLDDPVPRRSHESYFVQMADLVAQAAVRTVVPGGHAAKRVVNSSTWSHCGTAIHGVVNRRQQQQNSNATPGVVIWRK